MHTIKIRISDNAYEHVMYVLSKFMNDDIEIVEEKELETKKFDFSKFAGKLKWKGYPLVEQRKLRNEWD